MSGDSTHEAVLHKRIADLELELAEQKRVLKTEKLRLSMEWETQLRTWAAEALRQNSDQAGAIFLRAADELRDARKRTN